MAVLIEITPLDASLGGRETVRVCNANSRLVTHLDDKMWWPAVVKEPKISIDLFDGDFTSAVKPGQSTIDISMQALKKMPSVDAEGLIWPTAGVKVWMGRVGQAWPWPQIFEGAVRDYAKRGNNLSLTCEVDSAPFEKNVLYLSYAGTGGIEGGEDLKDRPKPWVFGRARNVEPVLIDAVNNVYQFSAYGPISGFVALFEGGSDFGASVGDYASYAALVAASIPNGKWASCNASGLVRLGAPAAKLITADVLGDNHLGTFRRTTGAVIQRIAAAAGVPSARIDSPSLDALDVRVPYPANLVLDTQETLLSLAQRLALPCNAQAGVSLLGQLFAVTATSGTALFTLDGAGREYPPVKNLAEVGVSPPYHHMEMGADRNWRVMSADEIAYEDDIIPIIADSAEPPTNPRLGQGWRRPSDGKLFVWAGINIDMYGALIPGHTASGWVEQHETAIDTAQDDATEALEAGNSAVADLEAILSDGILSREEKPAFVADVNVLVAEQATLDANATAAGVTTEKDDYDDAIDAMQAEIALLNTPTAWHDASGDTIITASPIRALITDLKQKRRVLTAAIAEYISISVTGPTSLTLARGYDGALVTDELPRTLAFKLFKGTSDETTNASWKAEIKDGSGTATFTPTAGSPNATGFVEITAASETVTLIVSGTFGGITRSLELVVTSTREQTPTTGGTGGTSASTNSISSTTSNSYGSANTSILTVKTGSAGQVALTFPGQFKRTTAGTSGAYGKWQWRAVGGSFADVASEIADTFDADRFDGAPGEPPYNLAGTISVNQTKTGLSASTDYEFQLLLRNAVGSITHTWTGTAAGVGS